MATMQEIMEKRRADEAAAGGNALAAKEANPEQAKSLAQAGAELAARNVGTADNATEADAIAAAALAQGGQAAASLQATGIQNSANGGAVSGVQLSKLHINSTSTQSAPISHVDRDTLEAGDYVALNLNQFHLANGKKISPVNGVYRINSYPAGEREEIAKQLEHYAGQYGLVEAG